MKKILMNAAIATGFALFAGNAFAADAGDSVTSIGFESTPQGQLDVSLDDQGGGGTTYWNDDGDDESTIVTNYTDTAVTKPDNRPDLFAGEANNKFLKIDSPNGIERYMVADYADGGIVSLDNDYFVDMNVQFTVSDTVLDLGTNTDNDKLAIWLYAPDTDGAKTNLVITAGVLSESLEPTVTNFVVDDEDLAVEPDTWYRLTVKTTLGSDNVPRFKVYVNTNLVSATATLSSNGEIEATSEVDTFASLVQYDKVGAQTLSSVTFQGVGALDDLAFTTTKPGFIPAEVKPFAIGETGYDTFAEAVKAAGLNDVITMQANYTLEDASSIGKSVKLDLNGFVLTGGVTISNVGMLAVSNGSETTASIAGGVVTVLGSLMVDSGVTIATVSGTGTLKAKVRENVTLSSAMTGNWTTQADESGYYTYQASSGEDTYSVTVSGANVSITYLIGALEDGEFVTEETDPAVYDGAIKGLYSEEAVKIVITPAENYTITSVSGTTVEPTVVGGVYTYVIEIGTANVTLTVQTNGVGGEGYDSGDGEHTFTIAPDREAALESKLPEGKTLASTVSEASSMTYAQAYALGLWSENSAEVKDLEATISFDEDGNVVVSLANTPATGYLVTCKVYGKASLTAEWPAEPTKTYTYGSEQPITPSATAGFYKVEVTISNAVLNNND